MIRRYALGAIILTLILSLSGCGDRDVLPQRPAYNRVTYTQKQDLVSVDLLASSLGMKVTEQNNTHITLKDSVNTVMLFTHRGGKYFVNGNEGGNVGEINNMSGTYYVSQSLVGQIRGKLTPGTKSYSNSYSKKLSGTVVIDPGHGGSDPGAISVKGFYEKTVNLKVARKVAARLKKRGVKVIMTRNGDTYPELNERADIANRNRADLFVSIHADSAYSRELKGFTVYIAENASYKSQKVAKSIYNRMNKIHANTKGIRREDLRVLVRTKMPAVLVEMGYISNHHEAGMIASDSFQNKIADAIVNGICDVLPGI